MSENELPSLASLVMHQNDDRVHLRRSPRKRSQVESKNNPIILSETLSIVSNQRSLSPSKAISSKRSPLRSTQPRTRKVALDNAPVLPLNAHRHHFDVSVSARNSLSPQYDEKPPLKLKDVTHMLEPCETQVGYAYEKEYAEKKSTRSESNKSQPTSTMSEITKAAKQPSIRKTPYKDAFRLGGASKFVLGEARCDDLDDSSGAEEEDEDTDLSGFIVDDNADLSIYEDSSTSEAKPRGYRRKASRPVPKRRLQRGHRKQVLDSDDDEATAPTNNRGDLSMAFQNLHLGDQVLASHKDAERRKTIEIVDLTSSPIPPEKARSSASPAKKDQDKTSGKHVDIFENVGNGLKLEPSSKTDTPLLPSKLGPTLTQKAFIHSEQDQLEDLEIKRDPKTPPATPPRSPTKLKSPSKLLSPSKKGNPLLQSPHRQSMATFWDHNVINEWNDQFSPKKAPKTSPRKNPLSRFNSWSDSDSDISGSFNNTSESLPSPCESPSKSRHEHTSPTKEEKAERRRLADENKAKKACKKAFDERKSDFGMELLRALDENVTNSQISKMASSTGGVQIIWSKTLRSSAGRANWRRTVTKASGSPVKGLPSSTELAKDPNVTVQHFANIELAEKVIDREERLVNTLAHEFCHLANFMVSGVRDQPHGESFKLWAAKVTKWMKSQNNHPKWHVVQVTTKHDYVIEHKYLWVCAGRQQSMAMKMLNIDDDEGCGLEYGRHSKSIDVEKHRCGRCKGRLVQVRPKPRASPVKNSNRSPLKKNEKIDVSVLEKMVEVVELSD